MTVKPASQSQPNHHLGLRSVAIYEFTKGFLVLLVGLGLLSLVHRDVQASAENILHTFHLDPAWHYSKLFIEKSATLTDNKLRWLAVLALSYSALRFLIVFGLWRERPWAEWVTAISAGVYIPLEIIHLVEKPGLASVIVPVINIAIVIYLAWVLADRHRKKKGRHEKHRAWLPARMSASAWVFPVVLVLLLARWAAQLWLDRLNERHVRAHAGAVPEAFKDIMDAPTYAKSVEYTLAKIRFGRVEMTFDLVVLGAVLFSGLLPWGHRLFTGWLGASAWAMAAYLFAVGVALSVPGLPFEWCAQFRLEQRFGFNTTTQTTWWLDRLKGLLLAVVLGCPLLVLILKLVGWTGPLWWLWAWGCLLAFQLVMLVLAPVLILPLFNKFTPLPEGPLRERLLALGGRTGFQARAIQVMDGSKRSRHSNAFFTGFGRFRKIVLFDTLIQQLAETELEAVLAHEIGHYKKKHIPKLLLVSAAGLLAAFWFIAWLARQEWFYRGFGFEPGNVAPALLLFGLLSGTVTFWFSPLAHWWSRRHEYEADAFAARTMREPRSLIGALRKLNEKNLSNLTPHPLYSGFYYSHPTLLERERALMKPARLA